MARRTLTLDLPDELYERIKEEAEASQRPLEDVALDSLYVMFPQVPINRSIAERLSEIHDYTDAQLRAVVHRRLSWMQSLRLRELSLKGKTEAQR